MQKDSIHILSTRAIDEAATAKAADSNIEIDSLSFISVQPIFSAELNQKLHHLAAQPLSVVFTSANAVSAVAEQIRGASDWKIYCTSGKTKEYVMNTFGEESIIASAKNAGTLADRIIEAGNTTNITFFCGDQHLTDLPEKLARHNILTNEVIVYTTIQTPVFIEKNYHGVLFFSPTAVHSFFSANTIPTGAVLFSIGQTTTAAIQSYCTNQVITSEWPGTESLLEQVKDFFKEALQEE